MSHDRSFGNEAPSPAQGTALRVEQGTASAIWLWATEYCAPQQASTDELVCWLSRGELPPHTLVWRSGWGEWLLAMQVAEFSVAFPSVTPGSHRVARDAYECRETPPPIPVAHYPRLRLLAKDVVGHPAAPPISGVFQSIAPAVAGPRQLRDPDAVQQDMVTSQVPIAKMLEAASALEPPGHSALAERARTVPSGATLSPLARELGGPDLDETRAFDRRVRPKTRYVLCVALGALAGSALGLLSVSESLDVPSVPVAVASAPEPPVVSLIPAKPRVVTGPCRRGASPVLLDEQVLPEVPVVVSALSAGVRLGETASGEPPTLEGPGVALGYAQSRESAAGVIFSPESLQVRRLDARRAVRGIYSVNPLVRDGQLELLPQRSGGSLAYARTIDTDPPLRIGLNAQGLATAGLQELPHTIWKLPRTVPIAVPAVAAYPGGVTVAVLLGRKQGPIRLGLLSSRGESSAELVALGDTNLRFGRPALASGSGVTALAVAARSRGDSRQSLWLAHAAAGEAPVRLQPFTPSADEAPGGAELELDTPALAALPGGGFALLFTRGQGWKRRVLLQRLSATLDPLDAPVEITTPERISRGASAAALSWVDDRLLAFHFLRRDAGYSLWVSSIECELD